MTNSPFFANAAMTNTLTTNILNPAAAGSGTGYTPTASYIILRHMRAVNKTAASHTISLWKGATGANAAGTELAWQGTVVPANSFIDWYGYVKFLAADFLVGGADANTAITLNMEGEIGLVP